MFNKIRYFLSIQPEDEKLTGDDWFDGIFSKEEKRNQRVVSTLSFFILITFIISWLIIFKV